MPIFDTPEPIDITVEIPVGDIRVTASDRADTVVEVVPMDERDAQDVQAAEETRVEYADGKLLVKTPKARGFSYAARRRSVEVRIEVPTGSQVRGDTGMGQFRFTGTLGECRLKSGMGHVELDRTGPLRLHTGTGNITVDAVGGDADISTGSGTIRVGDIDGGAVVKNSNGPTTIGRVGGDLRMRASNGELTVEAAAAGVDAKTALGAIRIGEVVRGSVLLKTSMGEIEVGIGEDTAAWLDVNTSAGRVRNSLDGVASRPDRSQTVEVHAHTACGDITIQRS
jgi:DUF4097 and DUF4098 domain-containing protein YvlB